jgi:hypothetical protein
MSAEQPDQPQPRCSVMNGPPDEVTEAEYTEDSLHYSSTPVKRPIAVYFIAAWSFLVLTMQIGELTRLGERHFSGWQDAEQLWRSFRGLLTILLVWHSVRLIKLKPFNRWLAIVSFAVATISLIIFIFKMSQKLESPFRLLAVSATYGLLSLTSGLYLAHHRFRKLAVRFIAEREKERNSRIMQKVSQKAVMKELNR